MISKKHINKDVRHRVADAAQTAAPKYAPMVIVVTYLLGTEESQVRFLLGAPD